MAMIRMLEERVLRKNRAMPAHPVLRMRKRLVFSLFFFFSPVCQAVRQFVQPLSYSTYGTAKVSSSHIIKINRISGD